MKKPVHGSSIDTMDGLFFFHIVWSALHFEGDLNDSITYQDR